MSYAEKKYSKLTDTWWTNWNDLEMGLFKIIFDLTFFYDFEIFTDLFSECVENVISFCVCLESCLRCGLISVIAGRETVSYQVMENKYIYLVMWQAVISI